MSTSNLKDPPPSAAAIDEETSDIEIEGMDMDSDDDEEEEAALTPPPDNNNKHDEEDEEEQHHLEEEDAKELEAARNERMELLQAARTKEGAPPKDAASTLEYLLGQSEVFAHFMAGECLIIPISVYLYICIYIYILVTILTHFSPFHNDTGSVASPDGKKGKKGTGRGRGGRMTEAEEDAQLMKSAASRRRVVRLEKQPSLLAPHCKMHKYQIEGLNFLIHLHDHGIHGILADEMGLGKTLQTISLLAYLRETRGMKGPHLVVVPKSVVGNWIAEFKKWCPSIHAVKMGGKREERERFIKNDLPLVDGKYQFDAVVTSYEGLLKEKTKFSKIPWKYLIIDEAHRIKNEKSSLSLAVRLMNTAHRLLITGTPLQNNLRELFALLNFIMPDVFSDSEQFDEYFSMSDESGKENVIKKLHTVLRPFMLRRVKKDVAAALPPKKETKLYIGLTPMQQEWYVHCLKKDITELNKLGGPERNRLLNVLMQLRKVCNHPYLFDGAEPGPPYSDGPHLWENAGKMQVLNKLLPKLKSKGSRVLIFCQMTRMLDILEDYMRHLQFDYCRIDGNTEGEVRDSQINEFNAEGSSKFCFLLSTRAGGLGINLATADIVSTYYGG